MLLTSSLPEERLTSWGRRVLWEGGWLSTHPVAELGCPHHLVSSAALSTAALPLCPWMPKRIFFGSHGRSDPIRSITVTQLEGSTKR